MELQAEYNRRNPPTSPDGQYRHWWEHVLANAQIDKQRLAINEVQALLMLPDDVLWRFLDWAAADQRCYLTGPPDHDHKGTLFVNSEAERLRCLAVKQQFGW
ncbi:hypothetical protein RD110_15510 [Rhodoferax koreense]|uniref:Uncharacterized protein n=2 Tax=Rhodoferax koreensis TaxID=1842727 RepID=A0A1P8JXE4_9BURK|nr:hypothetical protein RD110_15510 [Rhodoferax koreense]